MEENYAGSFMTNRAFIASSNTANIFASTNRLAHAYMPDTHVGFDSKAFLHTIEVGVQKLFGPQYSLKFFDMQLQEPQDEVSGLSPFQVLIDMEIPNAFTEILQ